MTIAIAVRTSTAAVFAADSKLTTQVFVGRDADGQPQFLPQTYDNATKIVQDSSGHAVALFAGEASLGKLTFMDYVESSAVPISDKLPEQEALIQGFAGGIADLRAAYYRGIQVP
ncbi:MAG: hypothetical protein HY216_09140, partial [Candidatus Rokubacteria bacterium]|nr:hypothetical protein [Candidatus Rokubacteria bacterium]